MTGTQSKVYDQVVWYGWNGGQCPVHHKTTVSVVCSTGIAGIVPADDVDWENLRGAFCIVKEHREPRDFWINTVAGRDRICRTEPCKPHAYTHVREVIE